MMHPFLALVGYHRLNIPKLTGMLYECKWIAISIITVRNYFSYLGHSV